MVVQWGREAVRLLHGAGYSVRVQGWAGVMLHWIVVVPWGGWHCRHCAALPLQRLLLHSRWRPRITGVGRIHQNGDR